MASRSGFLAAPLLLLALAIPARALASDPSPVDRETARALMDDADRKLEQKNYEAALRAYRAAHAIMGVPTTGIEVARTEAAMGKLIEARDSALAVVRMPVVSGEPAVFAQARSDAARLASDLEARIPSLQVSVFGIDAGTVAKLLVDGDPVPREAASLPRKLDPGRHVVVASAPGFRDATREIELSDHDHATMEIALVRADAMAASPSEAGSASQVAAPPLPEPTSPVASPSPGGARRTVTFVAFGVGVVGIGTGAVAGLVSLSRASQAKSHCNGNACQPSAQPDIDASTSLAWVSNVGFGLGVAGAIVGTYLLLAGSPTKPEASVGHARLRVTPMVGEARGAVLSGTF